MSSRSRLHSSRRKSNHSVMRERFRSFHDQYLYEVGFENDDIIADENNSVQTTRHTVTTCAVWPPSRFILQINRPGSLRQSYFPIVNQSMVPVMPSSSQNGMASGITAKGGGRTKRGSLLAANNNSAAVDQNNRSVYNEAIYANIQNPNSNKMPGTVLAENNNNGSPNQLLSNQTRLPNSPTNSYSMSQMQQIEHQQRQIEQLTIISQKQGSSSISNLINNPQLIQDPQNLMNRPSIKSEMLQQTNPSAGIPKRMVGSGPQSIHINSRSSSHSHPAAKDKSSSLAAAVAGSDEMEVDLEKRKKVKTRSNFNPHQRALLERFFYDHLDHPYAEQRDLEMLEEQTHLSKKQIRVFMTNARMRKFSGATPFIKVKKKKFNPLRQAETLQDTPTPTNSSSGPHISEGNDKNNGKNSDNNTNKNENKNINNNNSENNNTNENKENKGPININSVMKGPVHMKSFAEVLQSGSLNEMDIPDVTDLGRPAKQKISGSIQLIASSFIAKQFKENNEKK